MHDQILNFLASVNDADEEIKSHKCLFESNKFSIYSLKGERLLLLFLNFQFYGSLNNYYPSLLIPIFSFIEELIMFNIRFYFTYQRSYL